MIDFASAGCAGPGEAARLRELFDTVCEQEHIAHRSAAADEVARRMMLLYRAGVRDRTVYLEVVRPAKQPANGEKPLSCIRGSIPH